MILVLVVQLVIFFLVLRWLLKKKTGEPYSKKVSSEVSWFRRDFRCFYVCNFHCNKN
jgi:hypothetical protein